MHLPTRNSNRRQRPGAAPATRLGLALTLAFLCACPRGDADPASTAASGEAPAQAEETLRIVSLLPGVTEIVAALGRQNLLVGRSQHCNHPPDVRLLPSVGSGLSPDLEAILALRPTHVIVGDMQSELAALAALRAAGINVVVWPLSRLADLRQTYSMAGELLGAAAEAALLDGAVVTMGATTRMPPEGPGARAQHEATPRVVVLVGRDPFFAAGPASFIQELLELAGAENALTQGDWVRLDAEALTAARPVVLIDASDASLRDSGMGLQPLLSSGVQAPVVCPIAPDPIARLGPRITEAFDALVECVEIGRGMVPAP